LYEPALQFAQVEAPVAAWNWPAAHAVHEDAFKVFENVPSTQLTQAAAPLYWPAAQMIGAHELEPVAAA